MAVKITPVNGCAFLCFPGMANLLVYELSARFNYTVEQTSSSFTDNAFYSNRALFYGDVLFCPDFNINEKGKPYWAKDVFISPFLLEFNSIGEGAGALKNIQRNWAPCHYQLFRRGALIQEKLPYLNLGTKNFFKTLPSGKKEFNLKIPSSPMGIYTLINPGLILASAETSSSLPCGNITFEEDHENPPSRAYLKIQESLTLFNHFFGESVPSDGDKCFEAGACPGGWTWVLKNLGASILAVDRAELSPELMKDSQIQFMAHDAFTLKPEEVCTFMKAEKIQWVFSDVICYPERLLQWVKLWIESKRTKNIIATIKMQGETDWNIIAEFEKIPGSRVVHLNYNKHELTFMHHSND